MAEEEEVIIFDDEDIQNVVNINKEEAEYEEVDFNWYGKIKPGTNPIPIPIKLNEAQIGPTRKLYDLYQGETNNVIAINTSATGAGKTFMALKVAELLKMMVFIVCPASVASKWVEETDKRKITRALDTPITYESLAVANSRYLTAVNVEEYVEEVEEVRIREKYFVNDRFLSLINPQPSTPDFKKHQGKYYFYHNKEDDQYYNKILFIFDEAHKAKNDSTLNAAVTGITRCLHYSLDGAIRYWSIYDKVLKDYTRDFYGRGLFLSATLNDKTSGVPAIYRALGFFRGRTGYYDITGPIANRIITVNGIVPLIQFAYSYNPEKTIEIISRFGTLKGIFLRSEKSKGKGKSIVGIKNKLLGTTFTTNIGDTINEIRLLGFNLYKNVFLPAMCVSVDLSLLKFDYDIKDAYYVVDDEDKKDRINKLISKIRSSTRGELDTEIQELESAKKPKIGIITKTLAAIEYEKAEVFAEVTMAYVEQEKYKVVIILNFHETMQKVAAILEAHGFPVIQLTGKVVQKDREALRRKFQDPESDYDIVILSMGVVEGIDFDDKLGLENGGKQRVELISPTYNIIKAIQGIGRVVRIDTMSKALIRFVYIDGAVEWTILQALINKSSVLRTSQQQAINVYLPGDYERYYEDEKKREIWNSNKDKILRLRDAAVEADSKSKTEERTPARIAYMEELNKLFGDIIDIPKKGKLTPTKGGKKGSKVESESETEESSEEEKPKRVPKGKPKLKGKGKYVNDESGEDTGSETESD